MSAGTGRRYTVTMVCAVWSVPRSTVYARRGPRTLVSDAVLLEGIRAVLKASAFHTEGHRKVRVRLRPRGIYVGKNRVLRLMRQHRLLAPYRRRHAHGVGHMRGRSSPRGRMSCGGRMRRSSGRGKRAGAGPLERSITAAKTSSAGMWRSAGIGGRRWSRFGSVCSRRMAATRRRSPWVLASAWIGARSTGRISFSGSCAGSGSGRLPAMWASPSATADVRQALTRKAA